MTKVQHPAAIARCRRSLLVLLNVLVFAGCPTIARSQSAQVAGNAAELDRNSGNQVPAHHPKPTPLSVHLFAIGLDVGLPIENAPTAPNGEPTLGINAELLYGSSSVQAGGFFRWGVGGLRYPNSEDNGLLRSGPRLRAGMPLHRKYPSLFATASVGWAFAYASRSEPAQIDAVFGIFAAPGAALVYPIGSASSTGTWKALQLTLGGNYYFHHWLEAPDHFPSRWYDVSLSVGGAWEPAE